jgi:hypothetical protein
MLGKLIRIALALLVVNAAWRVGSVYWTFYHFEDKLSEIALFGDQRTESQLCGQAMDAAAALNVPIEKTALHFRRGGNPPFNCQTGDGAAAPVSGGHAQKLAFEGTYKEKVSVFPGYRREMVFKPSVEVWARVF